MIAKDRIMELISSELTQLLVYLAISLAVIAATAILFARDRFIYKPFIGDTNPVLVVTLVSLLGLILLTILLSQGWLAIFQQNNLQGLAVAAGLASLFALVMILADTRILLPEDINRPFPQSLLFYPTVALVVEILFHVLPLTVLLLVFTKLATGLSFTAVMRISIFIVALLEPAFQFFIGGARTHAAWGPLFITLHIFLINLCQLWIFWKYDFVSMYSFRLVYYLFWHIIWGVIRLRVLF